MELNLKFTSSFEYTFYFGFYVFLHIIEFSININICYYKIVYKT